MPVERRQDADAGSPEMPAVPVVRSETMPPAFAHGFSTRAGGVSAPPFDTLNLGGKWGDDPAAVNRLQLPVQPQQ